MSRAHTRRRLVRAVGAIAVLVLAGCGEGDSPGTGAAPPPVAVPATPATPAVPASRVVDPAAQPPPINALDIDPSTNEFLLTTNRGFYRIGRASGRLRQVTSTVRAAGGREARIGTSLEIAANAKGRLVGSGHPDQPGTLPEFLGAMVSDDGGRTWRVLSRLGRADLHKIVLKHERMYAYDAVNGALLVSRNGGRTFSEQFTPTGVPIIDIEVDPGDRRRILAASETELYRSADGGATWKPIGEGSGMRLAWPANDALYRALKDGSVQRSADGGRSWETAGRIGGEPYRLKAVSREELYVVIADGTILRTRDGAKTWKEAFKP